MEIIIFFIIFIYFLIDRYTNSKNICKDNSTFFDSLFSTESTDRPDFDVYRQTKEDNSPFIYIHPTDKQSYLKSSKWQTIRKARLSRDNYTCQSCKASNIPLEVHHLHYKTFGDEDISDLVSLCRECHQAVHNRHGYDYNSLFPIN